MLRKIKNQQAFSRRYLVAEAGAIVVQTRQDERFQSQERSIGKSDRPTEM